jgi:Leucine-rich repeat (LRR) protein
MLILLLISDVLCQSKKTLDIECSKFEKTDWCYNNKIIDGSKSKLKVFPEGSKEKAENLTSISLCNRELNAKNLNLDYFKIFTKMTKFWNYDSNFPLLNLIDSLPYTNLIELTICSAGMTTFKSNLGNKKLKLEFLSICYNDLTAHEKGVFAGLPNLKTLDLTGNKITTIDLQTLSPLKALKQIDLSSNAFNNFNLTFWQAIPRSVTKIICNENKIKEIPNEAFKPFSNLTSLSLITNHLKTFVAQNLGFARNFQELLLDSNQISKFNATGLKNIKNLTLDSNELKTIENKMFEKKIVFNILSFSGNKIEMNEKTFMERQNALQTFQYANFSRK